MHREVKGGAMAIPESIQSFLGRNSAAYSTLQHPVAYTAQREAALAHVPGREWAKTIVYLADGEPIQAVLPASFSVNEAQLRALTGARSLRLAEESEFEPLYPGCERGAMPPFGPLYGQRVFVDRVLADDPEIVFNAGTHADAIRMRYEDFASLVQPVVGEFAHSASTRSASTRSAGLW
jgi:Ala-tRNA(Pro) deacylase